MIGLRSKIRNLIYTPNSAATIILGFPKSGTSALTGMLATRSGKSASIDTPCLWEPYLKKIQEDGLDFKKHVFNNPFRFSKDIVKEPNMVFLLDKLPEVFKMNKVIIIRRNPYKNIKSILDRLGLPGNLQRDSELPEFNKNWQRLLLEGKGDNYVERLANKWYNVDSQLKLISEYSLTFEVQYEDFNEHKVQTIDSIIEFLNWERKNSIDQILNKPYQPRSANNISISDFFGDNLVFLNNIFSNIL